MSQFLLKAAEKGDAKKVKDYLDAGVDVNWRHKHNGRTALIEAAINGHEEVARLLLDRGADLNCQDTAVGATPLGWASECGHFSLAKMFLEAGANPNHATPEFHHTPLMSAAAKGYVPIVEHLLKSGADINATTCDGLTALAIAQTKKRQDVVKILEDAGAGLGVPLPQPARIAWPAVDETGETCDHSAPEKVLRSFIFAMNRWEKNAAALRKAHPHDSGIGKRTLDEMEKVFSIFCTPIKRPYGRQGSYQIPPEYDPEEEFLIAVNIVDPRRVELITRQNKMKMEYLYVALKKKGRWLLDSKKSRMIGAKWNKAGL